MTFDERKLLLCANYILLSIIHHLALFYVKNVLFVCNSLGANLLVFISPCERVIIIVLLYNN